MCYNFSKSEKSAAFCADSRSRFFFAQNLLDLPDVRRDLIQCHPTPTGPTIRAADIEQKRAESNDSGVGSSPPSPAPVALLKEKHVGKQTTEKRVGIPAPADGTVTELPAKTKTKRATGGRPRRAR